MIIIGIDCATNDRRVGLALGSTENQKTTIHEVTLGGKKDSVAALIVKWLPKDKPALLALDAPLGWPQTLSSELADHLAGMPLKVPPNLIFSRYTDRVIREKIGKRPLEIGADLIARTAHAALRLLQDLREKTGHLIPLVWNPAEIRGICAIEVYPAATLAVYGINVQGYKKPKDFDARKKLLKLIGKYLTIAADRKQLMLSSDTIDSAICILAAQDFLQEKCIQPDDKKTAVKEGWAWVRDPASV